MSPIEKIEVALIGCLWLGCGILMLVMRFGTLSDKSVEHRTRSFSTKPEFLFFLIAAGPLVWLIALTAPVEICKRQHWGNALRQDESVVLADVLG